MNEPRRDTRDRPLGSVLYDDLVRWRWGRDTWSELRELYYFYLDEDSRARLASMGRLRRAFMLLAWLVRSLFLKLAPARRLLLLLSFALTMLGPSALAIDRFGFRFSTDFRPWGWVLLLVVLMLELRDKLLARDEIQIAREVQLALLPRDNPPIPGWSVWCHSRPANDVGGDLVDYVDLDGFRHGVVLGDVAGKGLGAALLSAKLQATLRALLPEAVALDELGARANAIFHRDGIANRYATLFYAELEHDSGQMRCLNAGHNPAFVLRAGAVERVAASSFPLGMLPEASYEEQVLQLEAGDVMLVYSDGLTEATNAAGEEFGSPRLGALLPGLRGLPPETIGARVLEEVDRFLGEARPTDDLSLVVVVRT